MATSTEPNPPATSEARGSKLTGGPLRSEAAPRFHSGKSFFWGVVLILAVGFLAWLLVGYFGTSSFETQDQKRGQERAAILAKRNAEDWKLLNEPPSYMDKDKGKIRVPLARAMELALASLKANKPHPAYPLSQSPPQPAAAPTSPDKGAGSPQNGNINPAASNPTVGQTAPQAAGQSPTPAPPGTSVAPAPANAPAASATPQVGTAATGTPPAQTPAATNNALNPGPAASGAQPQPPPKPPGNTETTGSPAPAAPQPSPATPAPPVNASSENTPAPGPKEPGATPGSTP